MVVCKFFLQGTCKFGDFCKFEHQLNDFNSYQNSTSILRQSHFSPPQQAKPPNNPSTVDTNTLVKSVVNDMTTAEKGGQWLLSCYAPFKEKPAFPGFEDQSFEEVRLGYYEAVKNGTVDQYKQQVQMMLQQAIMKLKSLQSPSPDIVNLLKSIYNTPPSSSSGVFGSNATTSNIFTNAPNTQINFGQQQPTTFGQQAAPSMFAQTNQNIFSKPQQSQNTFAGTSNSIFGGVPQNVNTFAGQASNSPFGNTQAQPQGANKSIFGQVNTNFAGQGTGSIFGGQQSGMQASTGSIFGSTLPSNNPIFEGHQAGTSPVFAGQNTSMSFGSQPQVQTGGPNIFAKPFEQTNSFGPQTNPNAFGQPSQGAPNIFGAPPNAQANQVFGAPTTIQSMPQQASTNIFGGAVNSVIGQQNSNSPFGQPIKSTVDAQTHTSSIFGNSQLVGSSNPVFGQVQPPQQIDESIYSKLEDLTEEEIKWFESDDLDIMNIPDNPPTYQMCFKT